MKFVLRHYEIEGNFHWIPPTTSRFASATTKRNNTASVTLSKLRPSFIAGIAMEEVESSTIHSLQDNDPSDLDGNADHDLWCDDEDVCNESSGALNVGSDLDREWQRRHNQFHTIGYRDGLTAGKEASAQEGFNDGFKQSVLVGYKWGFVRGITSALVHLPIGLKEKLVEVQETREKLQNLHESVHAVSTDKALSEFHADIMVTQAKDGSLLDANKALEFPSSNLLGRYVGEFDSLNDELFPLGMQAVIKSQAMG